MHFLSKNIVKVPSKNAPILHIHLSSRKFSCGDTFKSTFFEIFDISQVMVPKKLPYYSKYGL